MLAVAAGVSFALIGITYKMGQSRGVLPAQVMLVMSAIGGLVYGARAATLDLSPMPRSIVLLGIGVGLTQWMALQLVSAALRKGPLSAAWCAISLSFLLVFPYALVVFGRSPGFFQLASAVLAALCVISASLNQGSSGGLDTGPKPGWKSLWYLLLLVALLLVNSVISIGQYDLSQRHAGEATLLGLYSSVFYSVLYATLVITLLTQLLLQRRLHPRRGAMWRLGLLAGAGSVAGLYTQGVAVGLAGPVIYAIGGAAGLIFTALVAAVAFKEQRTLLWYATIALGAAAVVMGNL